MDPATVLGLIGTCSSISQDISSFITSINNLLNRCHRNDMNTEVLIAHIETMRLAADRLGDWLNRRGDVLTTKEISSVGNSLEACALLIQALNRAVGSTADEHQLKSPKNGLKMLWQQTQINEYASSMNHQVMSLDLHFEILNLPDPSARRQRLRCPESKAILARATSSATSISSAISWVLMTITSTTESSSSESSVDGPSYCSFAAPTRGTSSGLPPVPARGTSELLTVENLARLRLDDELPPSIAAELPSGEMRPKAGYVISKNKGKAKLSKTSSPSSSSGSSTSIGERSKGGSTTRPSHRPSPKLPSMPIRYNLNDAGSHINAGSAHNYSKRGYEYEAENTSDSELSDSAESIMTITTELNQIKNSVEAAQGADGVDSMEDALKNLGSVRSTIRCLGMKARTSRAQLSELDDTVHGLFVQIEEMLRKVKDSPAPGVISLPQAIKLGDLALVRNLLRNGAKINESYELGKTALHLAVKQSEVEVVEMLTREGADLEVRDSVGLTPLLDVDFQTLSDEVEQIVHCLLEAGANVNARAVGEETALYRAASSCNLAVVDLLLEYGAEVDPRKGREQLTPLHICCSAVALHEKHATIKHLLDSGADIQATSTDGESPLDLALQSVDNEEYQLEILEPKKRLFTARVCYYCGSYRATVTAISTLIEKCTSKTLNLSARTRRMINGTFLFRNLQNLTDLSVRQARAQFKDLHVSILLEPDVNLQRAIRNFYGPRIEDDPVPEKLRRKAPEDRNGDRNRDWNRDKGSNMSSRDRDRDRGRDRIRFPWGLSKPYSIRSRSRSSSVTARPRRSTKKLR